MMFHFLLYGAAALANGLPPCAPYDLRGPEYSGGVRWAQRALTEHRKGPCLGEHSAVGHLSERLATLPGVVTPAEAVDWHTLMAYASPEVIWKGRSWKAALRLARGRVRAEDAARLDRFNNPTELTRDGTALHLNLPKDGPWAAFVDGLPWSADALPDDRPIIVQIVDAKESVVPVADILTGGGDPVSRGGFGGAAWYIDPAKALPVSFGDVQRALYAKPLVESLRTARAEAEGLRGEAARVPVLERASAASAVQYADALAEEHRRRRAVRPFAVGAAGAGVASAVLIGASLLVRDRYDEEVATCLKDACDGDGVMSRYEQTNALFAAGAGFGVAALGLGVTVVVLEW